MTKAEKFFKADKELQKVFKVPGQEIYFRSEERADAFASNQGVEMEVIEREGKSSKAAAKPAKATEKKPDKTEANDADKKELDALRDEYEALAGKRVYHGWDAEQLKAKIEELKKAE